MSAIDQLFTKLRGADQKAFMPFITAGDPSLEFTANCLRKLDQGGCHLIELGIPYSDPIADGPVIQASYTRALNSGTELAGIFKMLQGVTPEISTPIVMMVSYAIVYRWGLDEFLEQAISAGVSGAIIPDMPVDESVEFAKRCEARDFSLIQLITPTTPPERAKMIAETSTGFIYYVSITGITGERQELPADLVDNLSKLRSSTNVPVCVGFGISRPDQATLLKSVADGVIVGSAIVRRIATCTTEQKDTNIVLQEIGEFAESMIAALNS